MNELAIQVENLSKRYRIGKSQIASNGRRSLPRRLASSFDYLRSTIGSADEEEILWALKDISFEVKHGEVVGIIGPNGAGKSTLLKILSRITEPTSGRAIIGGRVGSLLEVGTGFHPQLTGRENIFLSGAVLGMRRAEIDQRFDEIVDFSGVERFLDTQVKRYSSGMYVRLAFSVAAHLQPEILIVDEVLAVGDAAFQKKCLGKMSDVAGKGRTVLFVSHNMIAVQNLCESTIWLDSGEIVEQGPTDKVVSDYLSTTVSASLEHIWHDVANAPGNDLVRIHRVTAKPQGGNTSDEITMETPLEVEVEFWNLVPGANLHVTLHFHDEQRVVAFVSSTMEQVEAATETSLPTGRYRSKCYVPGNFLNAGTYQISVLLVRDASAVTYRLDTVLSFEVFDRSSRSGAWYGREPGVVRPIFDWTTERTGDLPEKESEQKINIA